MCPWIKGWVFESYQMKPGIGAMKGADMKQYLLEMFEYTHSSDAYEDKTEDMIATNEIFFIATACNCHGVVNLFRICARNGTTAKLKWTCHELI